MTCATKIEQTLVLVEQALREKESYAAIEILGRLEPLLAAKVYENAQLQLYWKRKDVAGMIAMSRAGIQHALTARQHAADVVDVDALGGSAKTLAYNLASFTWPGWNEDGITLTLSDTAVGLDAARLNLRLAEELDRPNKANANALWLLGAHEIAAEMYHAARKAFTEGQTYAVDSGESSLARMLEGYELLADALENDDSARAQSRFDVFVSRLMKEDSQQCRRYAAQLSTAFSVFSRGGG